MSSIYCNSFGFNNHIIILTETWLSKKVNNSEIFCSKYQIFRKDRESCNGLKTSGGGVLIAVLNELSSEEIPLNDFFHIEIICVSIKIKNKSIYIICCYIPPSSPLTVYSDHLKAINTILNKLKSTDNVILVGDFNLPSVSWIATPDSNNLVPTRSSDSSAEFINSLFDNCLFQVNSIRNSYGRLLDLIFVHEPNDFSIQRHAPISSPEDIYHPTLELTCCCSFPLQNKNMSKGAKQFCFKKTNFEILHLQISRIDWLEVLSSCNDDLDLCVNTFYHILNDCFLASVPSMFPPKSNGPPWNTKYLSRLKNKKNKLFKNYKKYGTSMDFAKYSVSRSEYTVANRLAYNNYLIKVRHNLKNDPKSFYKFVNSKRRVAEFPSVMKYGDLESSDDKAISNMFADFFASTYSSSVFNYQYPYTIPDSTSINIPSIDDYTVLNYLSKLKSSYAAGPDGVPSYILKHCSDVLCIPLAFIFNKSLQLSYFPIIWKESFIMPLFKSGLKTVVSNYRGIAKLSAIPKLFEKIIYDTLSHHASSILSPTQHGFRKSCSTTTNLLELTTMINEGFINSMQTDVVYNDFSKAFDKVNHDLLLLKLDRMGFSISLLKWLGSYLKGRKQSVKFRNSYSKNINVISGVPQGSHLGPLLFTLFINDLPSIIKHSKTLMYADDVKIVLSFKNSDQQKLLQNDINHLTTWCDDNLMELNIKKCKYMIFTRSLEINGRYTMNNTYLELVDIFNDLGVILDRKLDFKKHISLTVNKATGVLGFIKRWAKEFSDPYTTKQLFTTLVRPILEYGSVVWDPQYQIHSNKIESVQVQFLLFCLRGLGWNPSIQLPSYEKRLALIKLPTLKSRRHMLNATFLLKLLNGSLKSELLLSKININVPIRSLRHYNLLSIKYYCTNYANFDPFRRICDQFNLLYPFIDFNKSLHLVKNDIIFHLNALN